MPNTNFQTIHQMGQAINEVVRQATGRDAVQNIDMDHVTVAQNQYYEEVSVSGSMVSFTDRVGNTPLEKCVVQIEPVQDLHGYDRPWAGGAGKNLCPPVFIQAQGSTNGYAYTLNDNGSVTITGSYTGSANGIIDLAHANRFVLPAGTYIVSGGTTAIFDRSGIRPQIVNAATNAQIVLSGAPATFTLSEDTEIWYRFHIQYEKASQAPMPLPPEGITFYPMIRRASVIDDTFEPYSNICPITGWTGVNIHVSPTTDAQDGTTYSITFPAEAGTVYGGTLTVNSDGSGTLVVDRQMSQLSSFNWIYEASNLGFICADTNIKHDINSEVISSIFAWSSVIKPNMPDNTIRINSSNNGGLFVKTINISSTSDLRTLIAGQTVVFPLETPVTYTLNTEQIKTLLGANYIWADSGDIEVQVKLLKELY